ncbi:MAG TPA: arsenite methyltransferase [Candidatus Bathyarchaeia archaeon]|nr:arsenite methyltransferase [Candidatus Bathyarchaeia archaeon]
MTEKAVIRESVKQAYSSLAQNSDLSCCDSSKSEKLQRYGYSEAELKSLPESVIVMSDGCGNPTGLGQIKPGDVVLDLGSGGGIDVFLASKKVGPSGKVIGLDMTEDMVNRAQSNAVKLGFSNVEFKLGEIENIPLGEDSVDVIMSNCVICLSTDKERVFREMFRVLRPGGRLAIADEVALRPFSEVERADPLKWSSCITGAVTEEAYSGMLSNVGFQDVYVKQLRKGSGAMEGVFSAFISGTKPAKPR